VWLSGGDPKNFRSNYQIAQDPATAQPGHSYEATFRRIQRKLARDRRYYARVHAVWLSEDRYPYTKYLLALKELVEIGVHRDRWNTLLRVAEGHLADYRAKIGEPPADITMEALKADAARAMIPQPTPGVTNILHNLFAARRDTL
jgi:hypothetical protein